MSRISQIKSQLTGAGARPNQFYVTISFPTTFVDDAPGVTTSTSFLCKATNLPSSNVEDIPLPFLGRVGHLAGDRVFQPWVCSIYNATDFKIRNAFEKWSAGFLHHSRTTGRLHDEAGNSLYQLDMQVHQLDRENERILKTYSFVDAYPTDLGAIQVDYDAQSQLEIFDVQFMYDYWEADTTRAGEAISPEITNSGLRGILQELTV